MAEAQNTKARKRRVWLCLCDCGNTVIVASSDLSTGHTKSCGCRPLTHNKTDTKTYTTYHAMKQRCLNKKHIHFLDYGGRGISICDRWLYSFENFLEDMGERPEGTTLDRINNNDNYYRENCIWSTKKEQLRNTRKSLKIIFDKKEISYITICENYGLSHIYVRQLSKKLNTSLEDAIYLAIERKIYKNYNKSWSPIKRFPLLM